MKDKMNQLHIDVFGICGLKCTGNEEFHSEDHIVDYSGHKKEDWELFSPSENIWQRQYLSVTEQYEKDFEDNF